MKTVTQPASRMRKIMIRQHDHTTAAHTRAAPSLLAALVLVASLAAAPSARADSGVGIEWGMDVKRGTLGLRVFRDGDYVPYGVLSNTKFCVDGNLYCLTPDVLLATETLKMQELEIQTAPVRHDDAKTWARVLAITQALFTSVKARCKAVPCFVKLTDIGGDLGQDWAGVPQGGEVGIFIDREGGPPAIDDFYGNAQVNLDVTLAQLANPARNEQLFDTAIGRLTYPAVARRLATKEPNLKGVTGLLAHVVAARAYLRRHQPGPAGDRKNAYDAYPKAILGAVLAALKPSVAKDAVAQLGDLVDICRDAVTGREHNAEPADPGAPSVARACTEETEAVKAEIWEGAVIASANPVMVDEKRIAPRKVGPDLVVVLELRTVQSLAHDAGLVVRDGQFAFLNPGRFASDLARFYAP